MAQWPPHVTVATVVFSEGKYLMVEERDKTTKQLVFNQPAGHLDPGESLSEAAVRETLEETGWDVELTGLLGYRCTMRQMTLFTTAPLFSHNLFDGLKTTVLTPTSALYTG